MATNVAPLPAFEPAHPGAILREDVLSVLLDKDVPLVVAPKSSCPGSSAKAYKLLDC